MRSHYSENIRDESDQEIIPLPTALLIIFSGAFGIIGAVIALGLGLPNVSQAVFGTQINTFWDLARSTGIVAYLLIWMSVAFGLIITNRMARMWPGGPTAFDLHQFTSLLGLAFALAHMLALLGDTYIKYSLAQLLIPFASVNYQPFWIGLGQLAFYALIPITFTFYIRARIGTNAWRAIHYGSFIAFSFITLHGLLAGSDSSNAWIFLMYLTTGAVVVFLTLYRMFALSRTLTA